MNKGIWGWPTIAPYAEARLTANVAVNTSVWTTVLYQTVLSDFDGMANKAPINGLFQIKTPGVYVAVFSALMAANATGDRVARFILNNVQWPGDADSAPGAGVAKDWTLAFTKILRAGDLIGLQVWQNSGVALNVTDGLATLQWLRY